MKKVLALTLVLVAMLLFAVPVVADAAKSDDIVVLYTNDVHTYIDGDLSYDVLAALKKDLQEEYAYVLLVDAGDHIQGTAYGSMDQGRTIINLMNAAGYDAATLGNHEFDYGMDGRVRVTDEWAQYPYLSCNFYHETNGVRGENVLDSYQIFECGSEKIAIVGVTTPESFSKSAPSYFQDENGSDIYGISGGNGGAALQADLQKAIDTARADGATMVIGLGHLGVDLSSGDWTSEVTISNVSGLDAFIDGHSHTVMESTTVADKNGEAVLLTQTGEYFGAIGMMVIDPEANTITTDLLTKEDLADLEPDAKVKAIKDAWLEQIDAELGEKIGTLAVTLDNYGTDGNRLVRAQETNTGDFAADALYYLFDEMDLDVDAAVMNGGGIRNQAVTGDVSYKNCKDIHTFGNVACMQTVTGKQLLNALEWGARGAGTGEEIGGFLHVAGLTYRIDSSVKSTVQMDDKGNWMGAPTGAYRVCDVQIYNKEAQAYEPLDVNATYNLAGYNYTLRDLGDSFSMFEGAVNVLDYVMEDYLVLANYVQGFENGVVDACNSPLLEKYPNMLLDYSDVNGSGRIVLEGQTPAADSVYTVCWGDTLWKISRAYGCTVQEVMDLNRDMIRDPNLILVGWELALPKR